MFYDNPTQICYRWLIGEDWQYGIAYQDKLILANGQVIPLEKFACFDNIDEYIIELEWLDLTKAIQGKE